MHVVFATFIIKLMDDVVCAMLFCKLINFTQLHFLYVCIHFGIMQINMTRHTQAADKSIKGSMPRRERLYAFETHNRMNTFHR